MQLIEIFLSGAVFVFGIVAGIGPQNLNIMSHAIHRNYAKEVAITCFLADSLLILVGCIGLSFMNAKWLLLSINLFGIIFLVYYLWQKIVQLNQPHHVKFANAILTRRAAILRALALTWLNPLVFIDTLVIIGGASTHYTGLANLSFTAGAVIGDLAWIFGVTYLSQRFADKLRSPRVWMLIDISTIILVAYVLIKMISFLVA
ncbi:MAG: hypothetical protein RLZZ293_608 [Pseudomonadota bacterium]|jgi:L-lysine exporter family protein LysE/ArgO